MAIKYLFKLYLSASTSRHNEDIVTNLKSILDDKFKDQYSLEIIVVTETPELVEDANIFSTPTLIKQLPPPSTLVVGDLTDRKKLLAAVDLSLG